MSSRHILLTLCREGGGGGAGGEWEGEGGNWDNAHRDKKRN
jgi:hypothetical protein